MAVAINDPLNAALAPVPGAVNVTVTPLSPFPPESFTVAASAVPKAVPSAVLCGVPPVAAMLAAAPVLLVKLKLAPPLTPLTVAVTV
jgi:hypothetical protein